MYSFQYLISSTGYTDIRFNMKIPHCQYNNNIIPVIKIRSRSSYLGYSNRYTHKSGHKIEAELSTTNLRGIASR